MHQVPWRDVRVEPAEGRVVSTVVPLHRKPAPAYTPMGPPCQCQTPGHEDISRYPARRYPGGRLCDRCIAPSGRGYRSSDEKGDTA